MEMELVKTPLDPITVSATQALNSLIIMIAWVSTQSFIASLSFLHNILKHRIKPKNKYVYYSNCACVQKICNIIN